ncbi:hypothetical protein D6779_04675 [Candidatus Parcubacteria bacterium]|nr:MAG: hypothetical protein D6779_04675 [Candidatus Parcubacteria bacterium]
MKYPSSYYARALAEVLATDNLSEEAQARICQRFLALLTRHGMRARAKKILREAERLLLARTGRRKVDIEFARTPQESADKLFGSFLKSSDVVTTRLNPALIAGVRLTINDTMRLDCSLKRKLQQMFPNASQYT